jgi:hypothetical protein
MNPTTPNIEPKPSVQSRNVVTGGSRLFISAVVFLYLFFTEPVGLSGKFPPNFTAWKAFVIGWRDGSVVNGLIFGFLWLIFALAFGAFVAVLLGIVRQFLRKAK